MMCQKSSRAAALLAAFVAAMQAPSGIADATDPATGSDPLIEEIVVSAQVSLATRLGNLGSVTALDAAEIASVQATHVSELLARVPGVWISRGSGQEQLTAIRSPVYAGLGACGEFLYLEDGIPIRPAGFCNINNLFEVNAEQAGGVEVWRGPASAVLGGNALRGAVNVISALPERDQLSLEAGRYGYYRAALQATGGSDANRYGLTVNAARTDGWRDDTDYEQQKATFVQATQVGRWSVRNTVGLTRLDQNTGAFVSGYQAYRDNDLSRSNPAPEAYREAWSFRAASHWQADGWSVSPYVRRSAMQFLQHYLPGEPREKNGQTSAGLLATHTWQGDAITFRLGADAEIMRAWLEEDQADPLTDSSAFNNAVRPAGIHYDFVTDGAMLAVHNDLAWKLDADWKLLQSLRFEWLRFDYDNRATDGNLREDGTPCGFGGCLYNRPADRDDVFRNLAGRLGIERRIGDDDAAYGVVSTGYRVPQINELYRLQRGQSVADLDSERIVAAEVGYRWPFGSVAVFADRADHYIFRDAAGLNVSDGKTESKGVELALERSWARHSLALSVTWADHRYAFSGGVTGGEVVEDGDTMDTAPEWLGNALWRFSPRAGLESELEVVYQGRHYIDADNTARYPGHTVLNWRGRLALSDRTTVFARVMNLLDRQYADRADYTIFDAGRYRYFPAMPRQYHLGVTIAL